MYNPALNVSAWSFFAYALGSAPWCLLPSDFRARFEARDADDDEDEADDDEEEVDGRDVIVQEVAVKVKEAGEAEEAEEEEEEEEEDDEDSSSSKPAAFSFSSTNKAESAP